MKLTKKILIGSLAAFAIAMLTGCPGQPKTTNIGPNLLSDGDADDYEGEIEKFSNNNVEMTKVDGGFSGQAWKIDQTGTWSELVIDLTDYYAPGKSFLVSAKIKNDPDAADTYKDAAFTACYCVYSGAVKNWAIANDTEYYDYDGSNDANGNPIVGPWGGAKDTDGTSVGYDEGDLNLVSELSDDWEEIKYIITSAEIERMVNNTGLYKMEVEFYAGPDDGENAGYSFLIDDISIQDMNIAIERAGRTWVDPNAPVEPEEPEEPEEEE